MKLKQRARYYPSAWTTSGEQEVKLSLSANNHFQVMAKNAETKKYDQVIIDVVPEQVQRIYAEVTQLIVIIGKKSHRFDLKAGALADAIETDNLTTELVGAVATRMLGERQGQLAKTGARIGVSETTDLITDNPTNDWIEALRGAGFPIKLSGLNQEMKFMAGPKGALITTALGLAACAGIIAAMIAYNTIAGN